MLHLIKASVKCFKFNVNGGMKTKRAEFSSEGEVFWRGHRKVRLIHSACSDGRHPEWTEHVFIPRLAPLLPSLGVSSFTLSIHLTSLYAVHLLLALSALSVSVTGHTWNSWGGWRSRFPWQAGAVKKLKKQKYVISIDPLTVSVLVRRDLQF